MKIKKVRKELLNFIDNCEDKQVKALYNFLESIGEFSKISKKEKKVYNKEIDKAMQEFNKGNYFTHEEVVATIQKRFKK